MQCLLFPLSGHSSHSCRCGPRIPPETESTNAKSTPCHEVSRSLRRQGQIGSRAASTFFVLLVILSRASGLLQIDDKIFSCSIRSTTVNPPPHRKRGKQKMLVYINPYKWLEKQKLCRVTRSLASHGHTLPTSLPDVDQPTCPAMSQFPISQNCISLPGSGRNSRFILRMAREERVRRARASRSQDISRMQPEP